jgi:hypothetical protein
MHFLIAKTPDFEMNLSESHLKGAIIGELSGNNSLANREQPTFGISSGESGWRLAC